MPGSREADKLKFTDKIQNARVFVSGETARFTALHYLRIEFLEEERTYDEPSESFTPSKDEGNIYMREERLR